METTNAEAPQPANRVIRVMADYVSTGLWGEDGANLEVESVPLSEALRKRLDAWCAWYDREGDSAAFEDTSDDSILAKFAKEGREIAEALKAEHPDWTVTYFDELLLCRGVEERIQTL